jgi:hypothetical protein
VFEDPRNLGDTSISVVEIKVDVSHAINGQGPTGSEIAFGFNAAYFRQRDLASIGAIGVEFLDAALIADQDGAIRADSNEIAERSPLPELPISSAFDSCPAGVSGSYGADVFPGGLVDFASEGEQKAPARLEFLDPMVREIDDVYVMARRIHGDP